MVFVDDPAAPVPDGPDAHHLIEVLRLRPGELVIAADGDGRWVPCLVSSEVSGRRRRDLDPASLLVPDGPPRFLAPVGPVVTVAFTPVKGDRPEWVVQKLTELGVDRIVPLRTARSVVHWEGEREGRALDRLRRVAREASAQCRRVRWPDITPVSTLAGLGELAGGPCCLAHPGGAPVSLAGPVIAVGPEGGWEARELEGGHPTVGLGPTVLRAETAAVVAGTLLCGLRAGVVGPMA
jgi:16S rRNA (uracil1498-N3)-methyltransferase